jgi:hypothetical protein
MTYVVSKLTPLPFYVLLRHANLSKGGAKRKRRVTTKSKRCPVPSNQGTSVVITDASKKKLANLGRNSTAPPFSRIEITCQNGFALLNGDKKQQAFCDEENGWIPPLSLCSSKQFHSFVSACQNVLGIHAEK